MFRDRKFRAVIASILVLLVLIHTTPLYAGKTANSTSTSTNTKTSAPALQSGSGDIIGPGTIVQASSGAMQAPVPYPSTGAATFSIPIEVPQGRSNVAPNISLSYNSNQANSQIGVGWHLDMGSIQRSVKKGLNYSGLDFEARVNGSVSELVARSDWGENCFGNKIEGAFLKYRYNASAGTWEVTDKSGTVYTYGGSSTSRQQNSEGTFRWLLDRVTDVNGNYMTVSYAVDQGEVYIWRIDYTGNYGLGPSNSVIFEYESRGDILKSFISHAEVRTAYRLKNVNIYGNGQLARKYQLNYITSGRTSRSLLQSVVQYGSDGASSLPPITFQWQPDSANGFVDTTPLSYPNNDYLDNMSVKIADLNNDGKNDVLIFKDEPGSSQTFYAILGSSNGFSGAFEWGAGSIQFHEYSKQFHLVDVNSDHLPDIVYVDSSSSIKVLYNTGSGFQAAVDTGASIDYLNSYNTVAMADVNGDGIPDLVYDKDLQEPNMPIYVRLGNGQGGFGAEVSWGVRTGGYHAVPNYTTFTMVDLNNDGRADLFYYDSTGACRVFLSTGTGFSEAAAFSGSFIATAYTTAPTFADLNGDGLLDLIHGGAVAM